MDTDQAMDKMDEAAGTINRIEEAAKHKLSDVSHKVADVSHKVAERSRVAANKVAEQSRVAAHTTDAYVREYAWSSVALAAMMGVIIGLMLRRS